MFKLPQLPFAKDSMPDFSSAETFEYHHGKHHAGYVNKLNTAVEGTPYADMTLEDVVKKSYEEKNMAVFNNAAQHFNHTLFWESLCPETQHLSETLLEKINTSFESLDSFKEAFSAKAGTLFGSGWAWLVQDSDGKLDIVGYSNAENPLVHDLTPLLPLDVWEHSYYIDYRNDRAKFIENFWGHVNWEKVEERCK